MRKQARSAKTAAWCSYHVPRSFLKPKNNLMVVFEEHGGKPKDIEIVTVKRDNICTFVSAQHPAQIGTWSREDSQIRSAVGDAKPEARLECGEKKVIRSIVFASFGNPDGMCGNFTVGSCHTTQAKSVVEKVNGLHGTLQQRLLVPPLTRIVPPWQACLGKESCALPVSAEAYGADAGCPGTTATLAVQAKCARKSKKD
ncbi:hypothetical protein BHE74_00055296 [Ensete ventricosum]|nr:hypothetical protein GW17_00031610 [Ensete ventricosum]RWW39393.1 hypothetical protein BHE74_00055296 [Ensete ventricosum]RZS25400.1 hypothetical protein BHM03_00058593 [Ensete ventricosum]